REKDFLDSLEKIVLGPERPLLLSRADKERIAYHEGGHAILGLVVPGADPVNRVTIVPRGQALGVTYQRPDSDRYNYPEAYLTAREIDAEVQRIISESHEEARRLLTVHRRQLDALATALVARETLGEEEILKVTGLPRAPQLGTGMLPSAEGNGKDREAAHRS